MAPNRPADRYYRRIHRYSAAKALLGPIVWIPRQKRVSPLPVARRESREPARDSSPQLCISKFRNFPSNHRTHLQSKSLVFRVGHRRSFPSQFAIFRKGTKSNFILYLFAELGSNLQQIILIEFDNLFRNIQLNMQRRATAIAGV